MNCLYPCNSILCKILHVGFMMEKKAIQGLVLHVQFSAFHEHFLLGTHLNEKPAKRQTNFSVNYDEYQLLLKID